MADPIPPHRPLIVPGVHGYTGEKSVHAGDVVRFHVSSTEPYRLAVCQLVGDAASELHAFPPSPARPQPIHSGSYVIAPGLYHGPDELTLECWIRPWSVGRRQAIITQCDDGSEGGFGLFLHAEGELELHPGKGCRGPAPNLRRWNHIVAMWTEKSVSLWLNGAEVGVWPRSGGWRLGDTPLRFGSSGVKGCADNFLDGDIAMPVLYARALAPAEIEARFAQRGLKAASGRAVLGCWPLHEERGDAVGDVSGHERTGRIFNHATWMIGGPSLDGTKAPVFDDNGYDPLSDPTRGHGLRLASDDLYDCRWEQTHEYRIPEGAKSGIYVGRISSIVEGAPLSYDISFVVKKARATAPAPILVLCATNSWLAYSSSPFAKNVSGDAVWPRRAVGLPPAHPDAPNYGTYTYHRAGGMMTYYVGTRMPWPNAMPGAYYDPAGIGFGQWARMERHLHKWLDQAGYDYDVIADHDLHRDPGLLAPYRTVILAGHSEYWSIPAYDGLDRYLADGGAAIVLSGNTMCWRVSYNEDCTVMEQRKVGRDSEAAPAGPYAEQYHSQDWARGGYLRVVERSGARVIGLETAGWAFAEAEDFGVYEVETPNHFLFNMPHKIDVVRGATFGHGPDGQLPRAIGHEWDLTLATLMKMTPAIPEGGSLPPIDTSMEVIANGRRKAPGKDDGYLDFFFEPTGAIEGLSAEMIYWERPDGGRVFNAGAVAACWVLAIDPVFDKLLRNVLHHFGITSSG